MIIKSSKFCLLLRRVNYTWQFSAPFLCSITSVESAEYNLAIEEFVIHPLMETSIFLPLAGVSLYVKISFKMWHRKIVHLHERRSSVTIFQRISHDSLDSMNHIEYVSCPEFKTYFSMHYDNFFLSFSTASGRMVLIACDYKSPYEICSLLHSGELYRCGKISASDVSRTQCNAMNHLNRD